MTTAFEDNRNNGTHKRRRVTKCYIGLGLGFFGIDSETSIGHNLDLVEVREMRRDNGGTELKHNYKFLYEIRNVEHQLRMGLFTRNVNVS
jgi:hypothetical protein